MKKIIGQTEYMAALLIIVLAFFPWQGLLGQTAIDVTMGVLQNITTVATVDAYAITVSVVFAVVAIVMALLGRDNDLFPLISFVGILVAFVYGMIDTSGDYFSSMKLAYYIVLLISILMVLKKFGLIKLK